MAWWSHVKIGDPLDHYYPHQDVQGWLLTYIDEICEEQIKIGLYGWSNPHKNKYFKWFYKKEINKSFAPINTHTPSSTFLQTINVSFDDCKAALLYHNKKNDKKYIVVITKQDIIKYDILNGIHSKIATIPSIDDVEDDEDDDNNWYVSVMGDELFLIYPYCTYIEMNILNLNETETNKKTIKWDIREIDETEGIEFDADTIIFNDEDNNLIYFINSSISSKSAHFGIYDILKNEFIIKTVRNPYEPHGRIKFADFMHNNNDKKINKSLITLNIRKKIESYCFNFIKDEWEKTDCSQCQIPPDPAKYHLRTVVIYKYLFCIISVGGMHILDTRNNKWYNIKKLMPGPQSKLINTKDNFIHFIGGYDNRLFHIKIDLLEVIPHQIIKANHNEIKKLINGYIYHYSKNFNLWHKLPNALVGIVWLYFPEFLYFN